MRILKLAQSLSVQVRQNSLTRPSVWVAFGYGSEIVIRLGTNLILTRLLAPELFGLMAIANVIVTGLFLMTDAGIGQALIQNKEGENREFIDTAWTLQVFRAIIISIIAVFISNPVANFYDIQEFNQIIPVMAIGIFFSGFQSSFTMIASRKLWLGRITLLKVLCQLISNLIIIYWAYYSATIWAFIAGYVVNAVAFSVFSHLLHSDWKSRFCWNTNRVREILKFGKWMFFTSILVFLAGQLDRLAIGKLAPLDEVGVYGIAMIWAMLPVQASQTWLSRIVFPYASTFFRETDRDIDELFRYRRVFILICLVSVGIFAGGFGFAFEIVYPENFWPAVGFFYLLMLGSVIRIFDESYRAINMASGKPVYTTLGSAASVLGFVVLFLPLYSKWGTHGLALAFSLSQLGALSVAIFGAHKLHLWDFKADTIAVGTAAAVALALFQVLPPSSL